MMQNTDIIVATSSLLLVMNAAIAFVPQPGRVSSATNSQFQVFSSSSRNDDSITSVDVSDLGLTMDDLNAPLPEGFLSGIETSGYESTSRIPDVNDDGCMWTESPEKLTVTLAIPGLRGQPSMCLDTVTSTNTVSVSAFGHNVWSCILRGKVKPETSSTETKDGADFVPIIEYEVEKANPNERWGGFILQIGEDSIL